MKYEVVFKENGETKNVISRHQTWSAAVRSFLRATEKTADQFDFDLSTPQQINFALHGGIAIETCITGA